MAEVLRETSAEEAGFRPERIELIRTRAREWVDAGRARSLVLLAARRGRIALYDAFGVQSFDDPAPLDKASVFGVSMAALP